MVQRYFAEIAFDGSRYYGWQIQPKQRSVQETIQGVLTQFFQEEMHIVGCGRTDTGVHAMQYFFHFDAPFHRNKLADSLKLMLPEDIALIALHPVSAAAHARFDATERSYTYYFHQGKDVFNRQFSLAINFQELDLNAIQAACKIFLRYTNYLPLCKKNEDIKEHTSVVTHAEFMIDKLHQKAIFTVTANRFLHHQIRRMVGVLLHIGKGKLTLEELESAMQQGIQLKLNDTVPAHALFLHAIKYPYINNEK